MWIEHRNEIVEAGLLLSDVLFYASPEAELPGGFARFPYSLVLTQACDIESYYKMRGQQDDNGRISRQIIAQLILCPAFDEDKFKRGDHLVEQYNYHTEVLYGGDMRAIRKQGRERFHYLPSHVEELPNLVIDFKHYFTVPIIGAEMALKNVRKSYKLDHIYYTEIADRFAHFIQRVAILD